MISFPNAKINLGLNILSKRLDGFHNISSCFYPIGWSDILEIIPSNKLKFSSSGIIIPGNPSENLCIKAYNRLKEDYQIPPVHIHLHKIIPIGAGLGGGSADGAFTLKMLNQMYNLNLATAVLEEYATILGSDCSFFIENEPVIVSGVGSEFNATSIDISGMKISVIYPNKHISTQEAYSNVVPHTPQHSINNILNQPISNWKSLLVNDFEISSSENYREIIRIKEVLYEHGALYTSMSGSGSAVFGLFDKNFDLSIIVNYTENHQSWSGIL